MCQLSSYNELGVCPNSERVARTRPPDCGGSDARCIPYSAFRSASEFIIQTVMRKLGRQRSDAYPEKASQPVLGEYEIFG